VWLLSLLLEPLIDPAELPLFLGAVMLSAWRGGFGPGLLATILGTLAGSLVLVPDAGGFPPVRLTPSSPALAARLAVFIVEGLVISFLTAALRTARRRAEGLFEAERVARSGIEAAGQRIRTLQALTDTALVHLDLDALLAELLGRIRQLLGVDTVNFVLATDRGDLLVRASHGLEHEVAQGIRVPFGRGVAGRIAAARQPIIFDDLSKVDIVSPILRDKGLRTMLGVPLLVDGRVIGVLHVGSLRARRFTEDESRLLELVADRIAVAIDHARLFEAERQARAAAETAERRFRLLVDGVQDYAMYLLDREARVASWNAGAERLMGYRAEEILGADFGSFFVPEDTKAGRPRSVLTAAQAAGRSEAELWWVRKDGSRFWAHMVVTTLGDAAGGHVGYATLVHDLTERRRAAEIRARLLKQVITAQEDEQRRIARELHDETGQSLTSLLVGLRALADSPLPGDAQGRAEQLRTIAARTLNEVRRFARGLRPSALDELGLVPALEQQAAEYRRSHGFTVHVEARSLEGVRLPGPVETALYRIVQEALTNAAKHANARTVSIVARLHGRRAQVIVADDGCGFDVDAALRVPESWTHLGLHGMRERAALLGGDVTIESTAGEGTTIYVSVPVGRAPEGEAATP
jgi:PAS domain S-box-containing protein